MPELRPTSSRFVRRALEEGIAPVPLAVRAMRSARRVGKLLVPADATAAWWVALFAVVGGLVGFYAVPLGPRGLRRPPPLEVRLAGKVLRVGGDGRVAREAAIASVRGYVQSPFAIDVPGGAQVVRTREELGARVDRAALAALVDEARDEGSPLRKVHARERDGEPLALPLPVVVEGDAVLAAVMALASEVDVAPVDARLELHEAGALTVVPERVGRRLDARSTAARVEAALARGDAKAEAVMVDDVPARTGAALEGIVANVVVGAQSIPFPDAVREADRAAAAMLASRVRGRAILPGETFDLAAVGGDDGGRAAGTPWARDAIASALHAAAFFAGLAIVERHPTVHAGTALPLGLDATWSSAETLRLRNDGAHAVVIVAAAKGGGLDVELRGADAAPPVQFVRHVDHVAPYAERDVQDPKVPRGRRVLAQRGVPGIAITVERAPGGAAVDAGSGETWSSIYAPRAQVWRVGTGARASPDGHGAPKDDARPELVVDEAIVLTRAADDPARDHVESRVAGKTGVPGWTARLKPAAADTAALEDVE